MAWVQSLVWELRSCKPHGVAKKKVGFKLGFCPIEQTKVTCLDGESLFTDTYGKDTRLVLDKSSFKHLSHFCFSLLRRVTYLKFAISKGGLDKCFWRRLGGPFTSQTQRRKKASSRSNFCFLKATILIYNIYLSLKLSKGSLRSGKKIFLAPHLSPVKTRFVK